uniref:Uncharacterized protein n=1 Tax=Romanomermis culicivorax TaxID=13658 RepID=A0A915L9Z9_ROMCU
MSLEIIETLINDCSDDCYFGSRLESSLLKSSTLNLARTALKNVNYQSYYLHFILGPILSLPFFPYLMNIHGIEDIFIKWETLHSETFVRKNPQILKIAITKRIQANKKSIIFRSFSFDPKESSLFESSRVTNDDIKDLIKCFKAKNRPLDDYSFSSALHYSLIKPDDGKPYDIRQELNVIYVSSENSPIQVLELVLSLANLQKKFADFTMQHINDATAAKFMDLTDQALLNIDLDQVFSKEGMRLFFDSIIQIYRYYDDKFDSRFSASRIDHCGFVHGILMMNMQEKYKLQVYVENNEIMYHDTIQMVIQEMTSPGSGSIDLFEKPIVIEFQDQGAETGVIRTISKVKKAGQIKLLPHIQTLADNCFFMAVNLISPTSNPALIKIPLVKLNDDKAENLISIIRNGADKMYKATNEAEYAVESITKTADEIIEKMTAYISTIQNEKQIYHVPSDVRYLSLYVLGEASTSDLPIHMAEYTNKDPRDTFFSSVEQFVTTFVLETGNQKYDIVFNIFEGPKKYVESDLKFLPRKSSPKVEKRLVIDLKIFPRHRLSQFQYSDDYVMKDFIDKRISISNFNDDHFIPYYPNVDSNLILVPKSPIVHVSSLNPQNPATPKTIGKSTRKLLFNFRHLITNDKLLEALFRGVLNGQNIASITDGLANEKSLIFATDQLKLMKIRFFTIRSDMLDMTKQILTLKNKEQHIDKSYSIILHMEAQNVRNTVTVVVDSGSNLGNVESLVDSCVGRSRRSADACGISLEKLPRPKNPRLRRVLDKINEISSITSHGILLKDMLGDLFNGDLVGLAVNLGIVSTGIAVSQGVEKLSKIYAAEKGALGFSIKLGAPFLRRLTSGFIIYDLINNIQNYQDDTTAVSIAQDSTFLLVDTMDIGSEIAQMLGFTTAEFLGPLGFTVGITLFVGGDIYKALLTCQNAFIVENTNSTKPEIIFMDLRNTSSQVIGFSNYSHIFSISNAEYDITGGNGDDTFVVSGNSINGYLDGAEGFDTLDLGQIDTNSPVYMTPETLEIGESYICFRNVNYVQGRLKSYDHVETWYELERIDLLGGADYYNFDQIHVHDHRNLQVTVRNLTNITFHENITGQLAPRVKTLQANPNLKKPKLKSLQTNVIMDFYGLGRTFLVDPLMGRVGYGSKD